MKLQISFGNPMRAVPISRILFWLCLIAAFFGLRLGIKTATITDTQIINFYTKSYLQAMQDEGSVADSGDCFAIPHNGWFHRLVVYCMPNDERIYIYQVGLWGQLTTGRPILDEAAQ